MDGAKYKPNHKPGQGEISAHKLTLMDYGQFIYATDLKLAQRRISERFAEEPPKKVKKSKSERLREDMSSIYGNKSKQN